jgi:hypothetical protein
MKPQRNVEDLAARLTSAASKPVPLPEAPVAIPAAAPVAATEIPTPPAREVSKKPKPAAKPQTVQVTLRPSKALLQRYTLAAADRTRKEGKVISAQQVMLECLERGP